MIERIASFETTFNKQIALNYLLYLPADYEAQASTEFPLILFLHGAGERGSDLENVKRLGLPGKLQNWTDCPFIVIAPQCPSDSVWVYHLDALRALLDSVIADFRVDVDRVYLTGMSLGGTGAWYLAGAFPDYFAALAPICGHNTGRSHCTLFSHLPVWLFHGAKDIVVPVSESQSMAAALRSLDANVRLTVYPDAGHDAWTPTYDDPELYAWFLQHRRARSGK